MRRLTLAFAAVLWIGVAHAAAPQPGFTGQPLSKKAASDAGVAQGMKIVSLTADCPAAVQLQKQDVIFEVAGAPVRYLSEVAALLKDHDPAAPIPVKLKRAGQTVEIQLLLCGAGPVPAPSPVPSTAQLFASPILADGTLAPWASDGAPALVAGNEVLADHRFSNPCALGASLAGLKDQGAFAGVLTAVNALYPEHQAEIAACIENPAPQPSGPPTASDALGADVVSQLEKLKALLDGGAISAAEYEAAKAQLLGL